MADEDRFLQALAPKVGLHSPIAEAATAGRTPGPALRPFLRTGILGTVVGWLLFLLSRALQPTALPAMDLPLIVRVLYGGITEEVLLRWGFMTLLVWLGWRFIQRRDGAPRRFVVWMGIMVSAVVFGIGPLPMAALVTGGLTPDVVAFIVGFNTAFGILFGYLYWKGGLEAAILAHAGAHILNYLT